MVLRMLSMLVLSLAVGSFAAEATPTPKKEGDTTDPKKDDKKDDKQTEDQIAKDLAKQLNISEEEARKRLEEEKKKQEQEDKEKDEKHKDLYDGTTGKKKTGDAKTPPATAP